MAERSFTAQVADLRRGAGETFTGEGILAITKALLENGVGYVGGYQGAPISHLMDVLADAQDLLAELIDDSWHQVVNKLSKKAQQRLRPR